MRQLILFLFCAVLSIWLAFFQFDSQKLGHIVIYLSYPLLFVTVAVCVYSIWRLLRSTCAPPHLFRLPKSAWLTIAAVTGLLLLFEPFEFKIVYDELLLSTSAQLMHFTRIVGLPQWANDYSGSYVFLSTVLDKRPLLFPFLLSLVHDFTGYRYMNVFILNGILSFSLVTLIYVIGKQLSSHRAGILGVLLAGSLPLLSIMATSGHFEVLNLVMISVTMLLAYVYLRRPNEISLIPLVFSLILLSQVRYENSVYLLPFGLLILVGWKQAGRPILPWQVIICPLFLIVSSLHYRVILNQDHGFFQEGPNGRDLTFSLGYAGENLRSAGQFLFSTGQTMPNAYLLSVLGLTSVLLFGLYALKRGRACLGGDPKATVMLFLFIAVFVLNLLLAFFNYGLFYEYITNRLSLPLHLLFFILVPFIAHRFRDKFLLTSVFAGLICAFMTVMLTPTEAFRPIGIQFGVAVLAFTFLGVAIWKKGVSSVMGISLVVGLYILTVSMPVAHARRYSQKYVSNDIVQRELAFLAERKDDEKILWVSSAPYPAFLEMVNCTSPVLIRARPDNLQRHILEGNYNAIYVSRRMKRSGVGTYECLEERDILDPAIFKMETVEDVRLNLDKRLRISRLTEVVLPEVPPEAHAE